MRLLVVVPCRDEALVVARRVANLARSVWPVSERAHELILVDDGSRDGTAAAAVSAIQAAFGQRADVVARVVPNDVRPGKPGAVRAGTRGAASFDLVVLTDADVVIEERALVEIAQAFVREPRLALACGAQCFVTDLAEDGACRARDGAALRDAGGTFDRWTAAVRRLESRAGVLFSVHGQLCAWRADLRLAPTFGIAADDVDLRFQVKARAKEPRRVEIVARAAFLETKPRAGPEREAQAARRARAWFQAVRRGPIPARGVVESAQALAYGVVPRVAPIASFAMLPLVALGLAIQGSYAAALVALAVGVALVLSPIGRRWIELARTIETAARSERREPATDRWETPRL